MALPTSTIHLALMAGATATTLLPRAMWRSSSTLTQDQDASASASTTILFCSCCEEPRDKTLLNLLPDCFRCNNRSAYVCATCHEYILGLLSTIEAKDGVIEAWKFHPAAPINIFERKLVSSLKVFTEKSALVEIKRLLPFVPKLAIDMVSRGSTQFEIPTATVLIIDVSGYTALAEELAGNFGEGSVIGQASGAEALVSEGLNLYFEALVRTVHSYGGDVIKFAGDALICLFAPPIHEDENSEAAIRMSARNAVFCATTAAQTMTHVVAINTNTTKELTCHCGVATGAVLAWSVGDADRREMLLTGELLKIAGDGLDQAGARSVVIDRATYLLTSEWIVTHGVSDNGKDQTAPQLEKVRKIFGAVHISALPRSSVSSIVSSFYVVDSLTALGFMPSPANLEAALDIEAERLGAILTPAAISSFVSKHVPKPAKVPHIVNEMRRVTTVFTKMFQVGLVDNKVSLQDLFRDCQRVVSSSGGMIRQFIVDDKGCVLISVFGVASYTDVDDTTRALTAAVRLAHELPVPSSSGVATGVVFVGVVGWPSVRCEFAVVGDSVNLAARLMSLASKAGERETRCDEATTATSSDRIMFTELDSVMLKGKSKPTRVFNPTIIKSASSQISLMSAKSTVTLAEKSVGTEDFLVGREEEKLQLHEFMSEFKSRAQQPGSSSNTNVVFVQAKSGFGKSRLLSWMEKEFSHDTCMIWCNGLTDLADLVEIVGFRALGDDADRQAFVVSVLDKLRERRSRPSVVSISLEDTPLGLRKARIARRSLSFSPGPAMPMSPSLRQQHKQKILQGTHSTSYAGGGREEPAMSTGSGNAATSFGGLNRPASNVGSNDEPPTANVMNSPRTQHLSAHPPLTQPLFAEPHVSPSFHQFLKGPSEQVVERLFSRGSQQQSYASHSGHGFGTHNGNLGGGESLQENSFSNNQQNSGRMQVLEMLLIAFVRDLVSEYSHILFLLDESDRVPDSVAKALLMVAQENGVGIIAASRTDDIRFSSGKKRCLLRLGPLSDEQIKMVVKSRFGFSECPDSVWKCVLAGSEGNPLQACEWFRAILRQQFIIHSPQPQQQPKSGAGLFVYVLNPSKSDEDLSMVTPLEGSILYSFDVGLRPEEKEILKRCTVICSYDSPLATISEPMLKTLFDTVSDQSQRDDGIESSKGGKGSSYSNLSHVLPLALILDKLSRPTSSFPGAGGDDDTPANNAQPVMRATANVGSASSVSFAHVQHVVDDAYLRRVTTAINQQHTNGVSIPLTQQHGGEEERSSPPMTTTTSTTSAFTTAKYVFANEIVRNVIYKTMTFAERSKHHLRTATFLQESNGWDLGVVPIIVHHLLSAGERRQAFEYLRLICSLLLKSGSYIDALQFLSQALDIAKGLVKHDQVDRREVFDIQVSILLAQISSQGKMVDSDSVLLHTISRIHQELSSTSSSLATVPRRKQAGFGKSNDRTGGLHEGKGGGGSNTNEQRIAAELHQTLLSHVATNSSNIGVSETNNSTAAFKTGSMHDSRPASSVIEEKNMAAIASSSTTSPLHHHQQLPPAPFLSSSTVDVSNLSQQQQPGRNNKFNKQAQQQDDDARNSVKKATTTKKPARKPFLIDFVRSPRAPTVKAYDLFFNSVRPSPIVVDEIRQFCIVQIWCALSVLGDASVLEDGFNHLISTFPITQYPTQRFFLGLLCSALSVPLLQHSPILEEEQQQEDEVLPEQQTVPNSRGGGGFTANCASAIQQIRRRGTIRSRRLDIGLLERTVDIALQLAPPDVVGVGMFATSLSLLFFSKPFTAERLARTAYAKLKDAILKHNVHHTRIVPTTTTTAAAATNPTNETKKDTAAAHDGKQDEDEDTKSKTTFDGYPPDDSSLNMGENKLAFIAAAPGVHCLQLIVICQSFCGGLSGALQTLDRLVSLAQQFDLVKLLSWSQCASAVLHFKLNGKCSDDFANVEHVKPIFDWQALSDLDAFIAWCGMAFSCQQECNWFSVTKESLRILRSKRFVWWLTDCFEAALYCGLINKATDWMLPLLNGFLEFARSTLNVALPVVYRLEALVRAQRGEDKLALKALSKARQEAKALNLLFESQLCDFIHYRVFRDDSSYSNNNMREDEDNDDQRERNDPEMNHAVLDPPLSSASPYPAANQRQHHPYPFGTSRVDDFRVFGCSEDFAANMRDTLKEWTNSSVLNAKDDRWHSARKSLKTSMFGMNSSLSKMVIVPSCFST